MGTSPQKYVLVYEPVTICRSLLAPRVEHMHSKSRRGSSPARPLASSTMFPGDSTDLFLVERRLPGITAHGLAMVHAAIVQSSARLSARGKHITYLRSTFVPGQDRLLSLFSAVEVEVVRAANEASLVPFTSIQRAVNLPDPSESLGE